VLCYLPGVLARCARGCLLVQRTSTEWRRPASRSVWFTIWGSFSTCKVCSHDYVQISCSIIVLLWYSQVCFTRRQFIEGAQKQYQKRRRYTETHAGCIRKGAAGVALKKPHHGREGVVGGLCKFLQCNASLQLMAALNSPSITNHSFPVASTRPLCRSSLPVLYQYE
jgi:hypothetical protein